MSSEKLCKIIGVRVSLDFYNRLEEKRKKTNCQTVSEFARAILYKEKIMFYYTDASLNAVAIEIAAVRKELNQIGNNINQITKTFHQASTSEQRILQVTRVADTYRTMDEKVEKLMIMISEVSKRWLQGLGQEKV
jgi:ABC-type transporter Mla subunit MlaD